MTADSTTEVEVGIAAEAILSVRLNVVGLEFWDTNGFYSNSKNSKLKMSNFFVGLSELRLFVGCIGRMRSETQGKRKAVCKKNAVKPTRTNSLCIVLR